MVIRMYIDFIERVGWFEGFNDLWEGVVLHLLGCDTKVVANPLSGDDGGWVLSEECVRDSLVVAGVLCCMSSGDKPLTVDLADTSRKDVNVKVGAF